MAFRQTLQLGEPALTADNLTVGDFDSEKVQQVVTDLIDTMRTNELIGMAAPQIGENLQIFITEPRVTKHRSADQADELRVYINPQIIETSNETSILYEGCGSVVKAQLFGPVSRPKVVTIEAHDAQGKRFRFKSDGILARVIQHEFDHTLGINFIEKVADLSKLVDASIYWEKIKNSPAQRENSLIALKEFSYLE